MKFILMPVEWLVSSLGYKNTFRLESLLLIISLLCLVIFGAEPWSLSLLLVSSYILLATLASVSTQIDDLRLACEQVDEVNIDHFEINATAGPLKELASCFQKLLKAIERQSTHIGDRLDEVSHSHNELLRSAEELSNNAGRQSQAMASSAAAIFEMSQGIENISQLAVDTSDRSQAATRLADEGKKHTLLAQSDIDKMENQALSTALLMEQLDQQSRSVHEITEVIRAISEQTNLLALNAAIEAARAGDMGRGFAVVADEVRALAKRSHDSADEISDRILGVTQDIEKSARSMKEVVELAKRSVQGIKEVDETLDAIQSKTTEVCEYVDQVAANTTQQSYAATELSERIEEIHNSADDNSFLSKQTVQVANHLSGLTH